MTVVCVYPYWVNRPCGNLLLVLSHPGPGPMNRLVMMIVIPEPVDRLAVLVQAGLGVRDVMPTNRLAVFFVLCSSGMCISEPGEPDMGRYVSSVVSAWTGSDVSIDDMV